MIYLIRSHSPLIRNLDQIMNERRFGFGQIIRFNCDKDLNDHFGPFSLPVRLLEIFDGSI